MSRSSTKSFGGARKRNSRENIQLGAQKPVTRSKTLLRITIGKYVLLDFLWKTMKFSSAHKIEVIRDEFEKIVKYLKNLQNQT